MSRIDLPTVNVGNDFILPEPPKQAAKIKRVKVPLLAMPIVVTPLPSGPSVPSFSPPTDMQPKPVSPWQRVVDGLHDHSFIAFSLLLLLIGTTGIKVVGNYRSALITQHSKPSIAAHVLPPGIAGLNSSLPANQLEAKMTLVLNQAANLTVGDKSGPISPETIKSWIVTSHSTDNTVAGMHVNAAAITKSVTELAQKYEKTPVNQISVTYADGSSAVIAPGKDGAKLTDPGGIKTQADQLAKTLLDAKGFAFTTPLATDPFQNVTPAAFPKLIEINVVSKQMYLYENGQLAHSYPISAGAPETPTPIGQYKIFSKLAVQDMKGFNPNGTKYLQPHVHWINYFLGGGYAIHGNYWRPLDWFGNINSSHGCASLPDDQAKEVYDWAPIGTPVITHR